MSGPSRDIEGEKAKAFPNISVLSRQFSISAVMKTDIHSNRDLSHHPLGSQPVLAEEAN
jgi:hypothetical protein